MLCVQVSLSSCVCRCCYIPSFSMALSPASTLLAASSTAARHASAVAAAPATAATVAANADAAAATPCAENGFCCKKRQDRAANSCRPHHASQRYTFTLITLAATHVSRTTRCSRCRLFAFDPAPPPSALAAAACVKRARKRLKCKRLKCKRSKCARLPAVPAAFSPSSRAVTMHMSVGCVAADVGVLCMDLTCACEHDGHMSHVRRGARDCRAAASPAARI